MSGSGRRPKSTPHQRQDALGSLLALTSRWWLWSATSRMANDDNAVEAGQHQNIRLSRAREMMLDHRHGAGLRVAHSGLSVRLLAGSALSNFESRKFASAAELR